jgi:hypothetical protein
MRISQIIRDVTLLCLTGVMFAESCAFVRRAEEHLPLSRVLQRANRISVHDESARERMVGESVHKTLYRIERIIAVDADYVKLFQQSIVTDAWEEHAFERASIYEESDFLTREIGGAAACCPFILFFAESGSTSGG